MPEISLKSPEEISLMTEGGKILGQILDEVLEKAAPGISTLEIDSWIENRIAKAGAVPSFKFVPRYHWASCVGFNEEVVHSIPKKDKIVKEGDLLKIDLGMLWQGFHTDMAWTMMMGSEKQEVGSEKRKFLTAGKEALEEAIKVARPGNRVGHISRKIQEVIQASGYSPVEILTGHGIGRKLHEGPLIPGILKSELLDTPELKLGMTLAIEVIYNLGETAVVLENDGWTVCSKDGKISGLFEKTIAVTCAEPLILTPLTAG